MLNMSNLFTYGGIKIPVFLLDTRLFKPNYLYWHIWQKENRN